MGGINLDKVRFTDAALETISETVKEISEFPDGKKKVPEFWGDLGKRGFLILCLENKIKNQKKLFAEIEIPPEHWGIIAD